MKISQISLHILQQMSFFYDLIQCYSFSIAGFFLFVCLFVCLFAFFWGGGGRDKKGMRTYHELFHWHSNRHMKHLDLNSILPEREFLQ